MKFPKEKMSCGGSGLSTSAIAIVFLFIMLLIPFIVFFVEALPQDPTPALNSTYGTNLTSENLTCYTTLYEDLGGNVNVTVQWYVNETLNLTIDYNNSYPNSTGFSTTLLSGNTSVGDNWNCSLILYNGTDYSSWVNSSTLTIETFDISDCKTITTPGTYYLTNNISSTGTCLNITTENVTIDCEGYEINYSYDGTLGYGIYSNQFNTTVKDCVIKEGTSTTGGKYGIYYQTATNGSIHNNTIETIGVSGYGVYLLTNSNYNNITNNTINSTGSSGYGVYLNSNADFNNISSNVITTSETSGYGVYLRSGSDSNNLSNNNIVTTASETFGIRIGSSTDNTLVSNQVNTSKSVGFLIEGADISYYTNSIDSSNLVEGLPVNYTVGIQNQIYDLIDFTSYGQVIFANCTNITITNSNFSSDSLALYNIENSTITNNIINTSNGYGINFYPNSNYNNITNNNITTFGVSCYAIYIQSSGTDYNNITNNNITTYGTSGYGIYFRSYPSYNNIINNTIKTFGINGFSIYSYSLSNYNNITNNNIITNQTSSYGVYLRSNSNCTLANNTIITIGGSAYGIRIRSSSNNTITGNNITSGDGSNNAYGFYMEDAGDNDPNIIYNNLINVSAPGNVIFVNTIYPNFWNTSPQLLENIMGGPYIGGNYYAFHNNTGYSQTCEDNNFNGICDQPLNLTNLEPCTPGVDCSSNTDYFPLTMTASTSLDNCTNITSSGSYYLTNDIINSSDSACINISANDVTLDCQNYIIDGNDVAENGIWVDRVSPETTNITVKNCLVRDWNTYGIYYSYADNNVLENITLLSNPDTGIRYRYSDNATFDNLTISGSGTGLYLYTSDFSTITDSLIANSSVYDLYAVGSANSCAHTISNLNGTDNKPIVFYNYSVNIHDWDNNFSSIILCDADNSLLDNITLYHVDNEPTGLFLMSVDSSNISNINFTNSYYGVYVYSSLNNNLTNISTFSGQYGFTITNSDNNKIENLTSAYNNYGIYLQSNTDSNNFTNSNIQASTSCIRSSSNGLNGPGLFYNNLFNCTNYVTVSAIPYLNYYNTSNQSGSRIYSSGTNIGGNYYTNSSGAGYSDICADEDLDGFCDSPLNITTNVPCTPGVDCFDNITDYLPMSDEYHNIYQCTNITESGSYSLANNINSTGTCINISVPDVIIDCQGYEINYSYDGTLGYGVYTNQDNTTVKNCVVKDGSSTTSYKYGIYYYGSSNGLIQNNTITSISSFDYNIYLESNSNNNNISFNNLTSTSSYANNIYSYQSDNQTIYNNTITSSGGYQYCIRLQDNSNSVSENNTIYHTGSYGAGIYISYSINTSLSNNDVNSTKSNSYIVVTSTANQNTSLDSSNLASGKPVNYTFNINDTVFDSVDFTSYGQVIFDLSDNLTISNSNFSNEGLNFFNTDNSNIENNIFNSTTGHGVFLYSNSDNNRIQNNNIETWESSQYNIFLWVSNDNNIVNNNNLTSYGATFNLWDYSGNSNTTIENNTITAVSSSSRGIWEWSHNNLIRNNTINAIGSSSDGIVLQGGDNNTVQNNTINVTTDGYGIHLYSGSDNNTIFENNINNSGSNSQGIYLQSTGTTGPNLIYNNLLKSSESNVLFTDTINSNNWNTTNQSGYRLYSNGTNIGGNFYLFENGSGYSQICNDTNIDGFCDYPLNLTNMEPCTVGVDCGDNVDYLPMSDEYHNIYQCTNITESGSYVLLNNINSTGTCLNISASDVTLDCQGYEINYSDVGVAGYAVYTNQDNTTVKNCIITEDGPTTSKYAIYYYGSDNGLVENNTITTIKLYGYGIYLYTSHNNNVTNNNITTSASSGNGIFLSSSDNNTITNNTMEVPSFYTYGVRIDSSSNNTFTLNKANTTESVGYYMSGSVVSDFNNSLDSSNLAEGLPVNYTFNVNDQVYDSIDFTTYGQVIFGWSNNITISNSNFSSDSLTLSYTENSTISNNYINTSVGQGVYIYSYSDNINISGNTLNTYGNRGFAIYINSPDNITIENNNITTSGYDGRGIFINSGSNNNTISGNIINTSGNSGSGIYVQSSSNNTVKENIITTTSSSNAYGIGLYNTGSDSPFLVYNNLINTTSSNVYFLSNIFTNNWNTTNQSGSRVYSSGPYIGGNFYSFNNGSGYSQVCNDTNIDGFCDYPLNLTNMQPCSIGVDCGDNVDYLPMSDKYHNIYQCTNITESGSYVLTNNINSTGTCINISASDVTLDCQGYEINYSYDGTLGYGVYTGQDNTIVRNCIIKEGSSTTNYKHAIFYNYSENGIIENNNITTIGQFSYQTETYYSHATTIQNNTISNLGGYGHGIYTAYTDNQTIKNNTVYSSNGYTRSIYIYYSDNNDIYNNTIVNIGSSDSNGIFIHRSVNNTFSNNEANTSQHYSYLIEGLTIDQYNNSINSSNLAEGLPVNYTFNVQDRVYDSIDFTVYGQVIFAWSDNVTVSNSNFSSDDLGLFYTSNSKIENNIFNSTVGPGISLYYRSSMNNITGNTINVYCRYCEGIELYSGSNNNTITYNTITGHNSSSSQVYLSGSNGNDVSHNILTAEEQSCASLFLYGTSNNTANNNTINNSGGSSSGIRFIRSINNTLDSNNITTHSSSNNHGIRIEDDSYDNIINNSIIQSIAGGTSYPIFIDTDKTNNTIINTTINSTATNIYVDNDQDPDSFLELINVTFNQSSVTILDTDFQIYVKWFLDTNVTSGNGVPISNANLTVSNSSGQIYSYLTDSSGTTARMNLTEYVQNTSGKFYSTQYNLSTSKNNYNTNLTEINLSEIKSINVILSGINIWNCSNSQPFTNGSCWSLGTSPGTGDVIIFNSSGIGDCNVTNNTMPQTPSNFTVESGYLGTIHFQPLFAQGNWTGQNTGTQEWNITNDINVSGGTIKIWGDYPYNITSDGSGQIWRSIQGNIIIGSQAIIDGIGLGFPNGTGPGSQSGANGGTHGGQGGNNVQAVYGNAKEPTSIGSGGDHTQGGSAVKLETLGIITINGKIHVYSNGTDSQRNGAGGSIWIKAKNITGSGEIDASGKNGSHGGGGGRIALVSTGTNNFSGIINASGGLGTEYSGSGGSIFINSSDSIISQSSITSIGKSGGQINITDTFLNLTGLINSTGNTTNGTVVLTYTNCNSVYNQSYPSPSLNTTCPPPAVSFVNSTPSNNSNINDNFIFVNITSSDTQDHFTVVDFNFSLKGWWRMDQLNGSGGVIDRVGLNNAAPVGNATQTESGIFGEAFQFDGDDNSYIQLDSNFVFKENTTISLWAKVDNVSTGGVSLFGSVPANYNQYCKIQSSLTQIYCETDTNSDEPRLSMTAISLGTWYHLVFVQNSSNHWSLYRNGVLQTTVTGDNPTVDDFTINKIGVGYLSQPMNGSIDEVMFFNRSLDSQEILALYNATANQYSKNFTNLVESDYNITAYGVDTGGNVNETQISVNVLLDIYKPFVYSSTPANGYNSSSENVSFFFTAVDNLSSTLVCSLYIDSILESTNTSVYNNTLTNLTATNISDGFHSWNVTCTDISGNYNTSETRNITIDTTPPTLNSYYHSPNITDLIDPNVNITVTANITEPYTDMDTVILQYYNGSDWINQTITPSNEIYQTNITLVSSEQNYTYNIFMNDTLGNTNVSDNQTIVSQWDCTWNISTRDLGQSAGWEQNIEIASIYLNNTGDSQYQTNNCTLDFRFTHNLTEGRIYFDNSYLKPSNSYTIQASTSQEVKINASFLTEVTEENFIITANEITNINGITNNTEINLSGTLITTVGGPYLYQSISSSPTSINLTPQTFSLESYLRNIMGNDSIVNTAYNVTFNWSLPEGFLVYSGEALKSFENLSNSTSVNNNLVIELNSTNLPDLTPGLNTVYLYAIGYNSTSDVIQHSGNRTILTETVQINLICYNTSDGIYVEACGSLDGDYTETTTETSSESSSGGGGGSAAAQGLTSEQQEKLLETSETFELVSGRDNQFTVMITNPFDYDLNNVHVTVSGYLSQYIDFESEIGKIKTGDSYPLKITITTPAYFTKGEYKLEFTIKGKIDNEQTTAGTKKITDFTHSKEVILEIHLLSKEDASLLLDKSKSIIDQMIEKGYYTKKLLNLLETASTSLGTRDYENVQEISEQIFETFQLAETSSSTMEKLKEKIEYAKERDIEIDSTIRLTGMAISAMERGDYQTAIERFKEAELTYALETKGWFNVFWFLKDNLIPIIIFTTIIVLLVSVSFFHSKRVFLSRSIKNCAKEEKIIIGLMKTIQDDAFKKKKMSMSEYYSGINSYEDKLSKIIERRIFLETKKENMFNFNKSEKKLIHERNRLVGLIKHTQDQYLVRKSIETRVYERKMDSYNSRLSHVEEKIALLQASKVLKKNIKI